MSVIHLEKSVLTLHLKEIMEDGSPNHPLTWVGLGLLIFSPKLLPTVRAWSQPIAQSRSKPRRLAGASTPVPLSQWVARARQRELEAQTIAARASYPHRIQQSPCPNLDARLSYSPVESPEKMGLRSTRSDSLRDSTRIPPLS